MSYSTWHNYGYGIRVDDIKEQSVERLQALLKLAPELDQKIRAWLSELDIAEPDWDDYMDFDQVYYLGLATILQPVSYTHLDVYKRQAGVGENRQVC